MEREVVSRETLDGKGYSTRGRMNCWDWVGQLIFYKPGLERSWNEEWEKDSWELASGMGWGVERGDSWITLLWSETSVGFAVEKEKNWVVRENWELSIFLFLCFYFIQVELSLKCTFFYLTYTFNFFFFGLSEKKRMKKKHERFWATMGPEELQCTLALILHV